MRNRRAAGGIVAALLLFLLAGACGDDDGAPPTPSGSPSATATRSPAATTGAAPSPSVTPPDASEPPPRDLIDLARRFRALPADAPRTARDVPFGYEVGDSETFTVINLGEVSEGTVTATVELITDHAYFFVQDGTSYSQGDLETIGADFEALVYPAVTAAFGREWTPGVDADPRITILHADLNGAGGYVSGSDEHTQRVAPGSNEREMLYIDRENLTVPGVLYNGLVAHELQHLIHWYADSEEDSWVNEGLSQVASHVVGDGYEGVEEFLARPDTQLDFWPYQEDTGVHYVEAELFFSYLLDHYGGRERAKDLLAEQKDSIDGVEAYLEEFGVSFEDVFADWVAANYLDAPEGPYSHPSFDGTVSDVQTVSRPDSGETRVSQWGSDYYEIEPGAGTSFRFEGDPDVTIGVPALDGAFWWSNHGDGIDSRLTREIDLRNVTSATLTFDAWHDLEPGWDYAYVAVSEDGGDTWRALAGTQTTDDDPVGNAYGPGYTDASAGWVHEEIGLGEFAGKRVLLRFEQVTDDAVHLTGFAFDNLEIAAIGLRDDGTDDGWTVEGFRRIEGPLAQAFIVQLIDDAGNVARVPVNDDNSAEVNLGGAGATIVISGATRGTTAKAGYRWELR